MRLSGDYLGKSCADSPRHTCVFSLQIAGGGGLTHRQPPILRTDMLTTAASTSSSNPLPVSQPPLPLRRKHQFPQSSPCCPCCPLVLLLCLFCFCVGTPAGCVLALTPHRT